MLVKKIIITTFISFFACPLLMGMEDKELQGPLFVFMLVNSGEKLTTGDNKEICLPEDVVVKEIIQRSCGTCISRWRYSVECLHWKIALRELNNTRLEQTYFGGEPFKPVTMSDVMLLSDEGREVLFNFSKILLKSDTVFLESVYKDITKLPFPLREKFSENATLLVEVLDDSADNELSGSNSIVKTAFAGGIAGGVLYLCSKKLLNDETNISLSHLGISAVIGATGGEIVNALRLLKAGREMPLQYKCEKKSLFTPLEKKTIELFKQLKEIKLSEQLEAHKQKLEKTILFKELEAHKPQFFKLLNRE